MADYCANLGCFCHQNAMREAYEAQRAEEAEKAKGEKAADADPAMVCADCELEFGIFVDEDSFEVEGRIVCFDCFGDAMDDILFG